MKQTNNRFNKRKATTFNRSYKKPIYNKVQIQAKSVYLLQQENEKEIYVAKRSAQEAAKLASIPISKEFLATRIGPKGIVLHYVESHQIIHQLNKVFGLFGWEIKELNSQEGRVKKDADYVFTANFKIQIIVTSSDGITTSRQDTGFGSSCLTDPTAAREHARKEAWSDAIKRTARLFGTAFGLPLYDKKYINALKQSK